MKYFNSFFIRSIFAALYSFTFIELVLLFIIFPEAQNQIALCKCYTFAAVLHQLVLPRSGMVSDHIKPDQKTVMQALCISSCLVCVGVQTGEKSCYLTSRHCSKQILCVAIKISNKHSVDFLLS